MTADDEKLVEELNRLNKPALLPSLQRALSEAAAAITRLSGEREKVIEECARVAEQSYHTASFKAGDRDVRVQHSPERIASAIRSLAQKATG